MTSSVASALATETVTTHTGGWRAVWTPRSLWGLVALLLGTGWADVLYLGRFSAWALGLRLAWVALIVVMRFLPDSSPAWNRATLYLFVLGSACCMVGLAGVMGGVGTPYFVLVATMPLSVGIALSLWQDRGAIFLSGAVCCAGTLLLVRHAQRPWVESAFWLMLMVCTTLVADFLCVRVSHALNVEQDIRSERARREALEALALSEHRRAQAEKLALVGQLSAGVAHEINNPLAYVGANVDHVREELLAPREVDREALADVLAETRLGVRHIQQIVADLKGFARMEAQEPAECSLAEVVADAMKLASLRLKHVAWLHIDVPVELPRIFAVRQRLVQVVLNLLVNAGDVLETHRAGEGEVRVTGRLGAAHVALLVEDNGPGIPAEVLPRLFEPFFTTKGPDKGMGLGLNLSRELVAQFGGRLTATNRPEGGARLCLEMPVGDTAGAASFQRPTPSRE
ncbi:sensor histidine kinase [Cystobacter fuscus]|uniref:sensor histidine kinase n=1 Tax=Cystobacter fuscus TaxID=43 RepID=UPI002B2BE783|nr:two-component sensor histidine kinase [Cystobacter fuscus]